MQGGEQRVVGMLAQPLEVKLKWEKDKTVHKSVVYLDGVIVADALPVPLHVSLKMLTDENNPTCMEAWAALGGRFKDRHTPRLEASKFKRSYHLHPYWVTTVRAIYGGAECSGQREKAI